MRLIKIKNKNNEVKILESHISNLGDKVELGFELYEVIEVIYKIDDLS